MKSIKFLLLSFLVASAASGTCVLKQSTAVEMKIGPFLDDTDAKTAETGLTLSQADVRLAKNGGDWAQKSESGSCTHEENGNYRCDLDTTDTGTLGLLRYHVAESGALPVWDNCLVVTANLYDALFSTGYIKISEGTGTGQLDLTSGRPGIDWGKVSNPTSTVGLTNTTLGTCTVASTCSALGSTAKSDVNAEADLALVDINLDHLFKVAIAAGDVTNNSYAAKIVSGTGDYTTFTPSTDSLEELRDSTGSLTNGVCDSGSTTTCVDAARTEGDANYWRDQCFLPTDGSSAGQTRVITGFDQSTDTITFSPATTQAISTNSYEILPCTQAVIRSASFDTGAIDANAVAPDTIGASELAAGAATEIRDAVQSTFLVRAGTAQAGSASSITLDTGAGSVDRFYRYSYVRTTGGTGAGQARLIIAYDGTTKVATVSPSWVTNPDSSTTFEVISWFGQ